MNRLRNINSFGFIFVVKDTAIAWIYAVVFRYSYIFQRNIKGIFANARDGIWQLYWYDICVVFECFTVDCGDRFVVVTFAYNDVCQRACVATDGIIGAVTAEWVLQTFGAAEERIHGFVTNGCDLGDFVTVNWIDGAPTVEDVVFRIGIFQSDWQLLDIERQRVFGMVCASVEVVSDGIVNDIPACDYGFVAVCAFFNSWNVPRHKSVASTSRRIERYFIFNCVRWRICAVFNHLALWRFGNCEIVSYRIIDNFPRCDYRNRACRALCYGRKRPSCKLIACSCRRCKRYIFLYRVRGRIGAVVCCKADGIWIVQVIGYIIIDDLPVCRDHFLAVRADINVGNAPTCELVANSCRICKNNGIFDCVSCRIARRIHCRADGICVVQIVSYSIIDRLPLCIEYFVVVTSERNAIDCFTWQLIIVKPANKGISRARRNRKSYIRRFDIVFWNRGFSKVSAAEIECDWIINRCIFRNQTIIVGIRAKRRVSVRFPSLNSAIFGTASPRFEIVVVLARRAQICDGTNECINGERKRICRIVHATIKVIHKIECDLFPFCIQFNVAMTSCRNKGYGFAVKFCIVVPTHKLVAVFVNWLKQNVITFDGVSRSISVGAFAKTEKFIIKNKYLGFARRRCIKLAIYNAQNARSPCVSCLFFAKWLPYNFVYLFPAFNKLPCKLDIAKRKIAFFHFV